MLWSDELIAEVARVLEEYKGLPADIAERWVGFLTAAFPEGRIDLSEPPEHVDLSTLTTDPDDQHVCALAVFGQADVLFTFDGGFNKKALDAVGVEVMAPDDFLTPDIKEDADAYRRVLTTQASQWNGGRDVAELLDALERAGVPRFAAAARDALELPVPAETITPNQIPIT